MKIKKLSLLQRGYVEAVGCRSVAMVAYSTGYKVSISREFWENDFMACSAFWFVNEAVAKQVKAGAYEILRKHDVATVNSFDEVLTDFCSQSAIHVIPHANIINMANATIEVVEDEYAARKLAGDFRPYFKAQKEARQDARLLGTKVHSAAQDEVNLKIKILRNAIRRGVNL